MDYKAQTKWRWGVAAYLFLVGLGAGGYITGVLADFRGADWTTPSKVGVALAFPCCAVAGLVKLSRLGKPSVAWRSWMRPNTSWIARGFLILTAFMGVSFVHLLLWVWPAPDVLAGAAGARHVLGLVGGVLGIALMLYSGILLTAARPIAFWSTAMVPVLFLLSSMLSGVLAVALIALVVGQAFAGPVATLQQVVVGLAVLKGIAIGMYLQSTHRVHEARASVERVVAGSLAPLFWLGVALLGVVVPLVFALLAPSGGAALAVVAALAGIAGSFCLRQVVLAGGIHAPLRAGPFEVALPIV